LILYELLISCNSGIHNKTNAQNIFRQTEVSFSFSGIILATLLIVFCAYLVRMCCHLLVKSACIAHSRTYELLAFHTYGAAGKLAVEFCMIGFMMVSWFCCLLLNAVAGQ